MAHRRAKRPKPRLRGYKHRGPHRGSESFAQLGVLLLASVLAVAVALGAKQSSGGSGDPPADVGDHTVASVADGDTIRLTDGRRVRLAQIDTPEISESECFAQAARSTLLSMLPVGSRVDLRRDPRLDNVDPYGRLIRYVVADHANVNLALVRRGAASVWFVNGDRGRHAGKLLRAARRARRSRFGLWRTCPGTDLDTSHGVQTDARLRRP